MTTARPLRRPPRPEDERAETGRGLWVSAGVHGALVALVIFGGPLFQADEAQAVRIADVDIISGAQFDAMVSTAPEGPRGETAPLVAPREGTDAPAPEGLNADAPPARAPGAAAPAPDRAEAPARPDAAPERPTPPASRPLNNAPAPTAPVETPSGVASMSLPLPAGPDRPDAPQRDAPVTPDAAAPRPSDRVAPTPAPKSPVIAEADKATPESRPTLDTTPTPPRPETQAAAPKEAAAQIVTEADEQSDQDTRAPVASAPPAGRPVPPSRSAPAEQPQTEVAAAEPEKKPETRPAEKPAPKPAAQSGGGGTAAPRQTTQAALGPALTSGQVEGVKLGIQQYWRQNRVITLPNYEELVVTLRMTLDRSGKMVGQPSFVSPRSPSDPRWKVAMDAARIAAQRAGSKGFDLPAESYERWKVIEVVFNPGRGVSM
ncbi:MAG: hypothetical protein CML46_09510 [Rhodobacteraceae bacterium]|nr:hypothetical protein [Paracoccaceae bacterium]MBR27161.1 hypothetical protein [Paracoccaceae bacterium]